MPPLPEQNLAPEVFDNEDVHEEASEARDADVAMDWKMIHGLVNSDDEV